jgi:hypothetical protein
MKFKYNRNQKVRTIKNNFHGIIFLRYISVTVFDNCENVIFDDYDEFNNYEEFKNQLTEEDKNGHWYLIGMINNVGNKYNGKVIVPESDIILLP